MNPKEKNNENKNKQPEQEENQRNGHHTEGVQWGGGREK